MDLEELNKEDHLDGLWDRWKSAAEAEKRSKRGQVNHPRTETTTLSFTQYDEGMNFWINLWVKI